MKDYKTQNVDWIVREHYRDMLIFGTPFLAIVLGGLTGLITHFWFYISIPVAAAIGLIGYYRQWIRFSRLNCPSCGQLLVVSDDIVDTPLSFTCDACSTVWDTGLKHKDDAA